MERLAAKANLPVPKLYVIPQAAPNAFATGRNPSHASVAVTQGLMQLMDDEELEGVIAHELSHVRNYDILTSSIAATIAARTWVARMGFLVWRRRSMIGRGSGIVGLLMLILARSARSCFSWAFPANGNIGGCLRREDGGAPLRTCSRP